MLTKTSTDPLIEAVRAEMARNRYSQEQLGALIGLSRNSINKRLTQKVSFTVAEVNKMADVFNIPAAALYEGRRAA